jgi:hypothetical protein
LSAESEESYTDWLGGESGQIMIIFRVLGTPSTDDLTILDDYTADQIRGLHQLPPTVSSPYNKRISDPTI